MKYVFLKMFHVKQNLFDQYQGLRFIYPLVLVTDRVISLSTKGSQQVQTDIKELKWCFHDLKRILDNRGIKKIVLPKSCFDKIRWNDIKPVLQDVFKDTDVEILAVYK